MLTPRIAALTYPAMPGTYVIAKSIFQHGTAMQAASRHKMAVLSMAMLSINVQSNEDWTWHLPGQKLPATPGIMPGKLQPPARQCCAARSIAAKRSVAAASARAKERPHNE